MADPVKKNSLFNDINVHNSRRLFDGSSGTKKNKKNSTHLLTVLIISAIVQLEQRKGTNKEIEFVLKHPGSRVTGK